MYEYLEGTVVERNAAHLVIDVGGVGYSLRTPLGRPLPELGSKARIWTHFVVREDAQTLYGFTQLEDRDLFRMLLRVRGVGPGMALAVQSGLDREDMVQALMAKDPVPFTRAKGVGKKTAEQIVLDLHERVARFAAGAPANSGTLTPAAPPSSGQANLEDAAAALVSIGYPEKEASKLVTKAAQTVDPSDLEALVRAAIRG